MPPKLTKAQRVWLNQNASKANACLKIERIGLEFAVMPPCFQEHATALESHRRQEVALRAQRPCLPVDLRNATRL